MTRALVIMMTIIIFIRIQGFQMDRYVTEETHNRLKMGLNRAAHDASLQVDKQELSKGFVVFVPDQAYNVFLATAAANMQLKSDFTPLPGTLFQDQVQVIFQDYVDDSSGVQFPYTYVNAANNIYQVLRGPTVIYRVRVKLPQTNPYSWNGYIYKNAIFEYPFY